MKIVLEHITPDAEEKIASYAAICYDSDTSEEANQRRVKHLIKVGHLATLRFAHATFRVEGISRACANQFVRSKHLDFLQESMRYVSMKDTQFVWPQAFKDEMEEEVLKVQEEIWRFTYTKLVEKGFKKEDARCVLPLGTATKLVVTGNLQAWHDFIKLRTDKAAQWEIREVASQIRDVLKQECPNVFASC